MSNKQMGGEGKESYKGNKNDSKFAQLGGEGGGKEGRIPSGSSQELLKKPTKEYNGPGRFLGKQG